MSPVIDIQGLAYRRASERSDAEDFRLALDTFELQAGEVMGIAGPSGCGKSTLIDLLALLRRPTAADRFQLMGDDAASLWARGAVAACTDLRARHVGVVLQTGGLLPSLPVIENVMLQQQLLGRPDSAHARALVAALDLAGLEHRLPAQLSIGQRQRVAIARAVAHRPALVLADEPTASLGIDHAPAAMAMLLSLARDQGSALVIVSHDAALLERHRVPLRHCRVERGVLMLGAVS
ncbi:MAG: ABC transporter ATP-binding protein [Burkholderiales bacterium]|nr:ABC transporter ATP-binding protein [Burkholderiales bacterium]